MQAPDSHTCAVGHELGITERPLLAQRPRRPSSKHSTSPGQQRSHSDASGPISTTLFTLLVLVLLVLLTEFDAISALLFVSSTGPDPSAQLTKTMEVINPASTRAFVRYLGSVFTYSGYGDWECDSTFGRLVNPPVEFRLFGDEEFAIELFDPRQNLFEEEPVVLQRMLPIEPPRSGTDHRSRNSSAKK